MKKLKSKHTGMVGELLITGKHYAVTYGNTSHTATAFYTSLDNLNEDWEDYEEPKDTDYWCIDSLGKIEFHSTVLDEIDGTPNNAMARKIIGNYFDTREEAKQAVKKLKAWKLLKDEMDIRFDGVIRDERAMLKGVKLTYDRHQVTLDRMRECMDALHLLFGGEE